MAFKVSDPEWRDFEKLVFKLLLDEYGIKESEINRLTQSKKDGGYDGIFYVPCPPNEAGYSLTYSRMLFEAKLRSNIRHDLPLQEFSKALIISINKNADRLIIATNLYFSQNTIDTLLEYSQNTGLEIRFLTSYDIFQWLSKGGSDTVLPLLESSDLLNFLKESYDNNKARAQKSSNQSIYKPTLDIHPVKVFGKERKLALIRAVRLLQSGPGVITVEGEAGIGKSVFTNQVLLQMSRQTTCNIQKIDIEYFGTPRLLFMRLLDHIWHIPFQILNTFDQSTVEDIVRWIGDKEVPEEMRQTLIAAFCKSADNYHQFSDLFNYYLVEYLYQIYGVAQERRVPLLCFTNINYADRDLLHFLLLLLRKMDGNIHILLELRTSLYVDGRVSDQDWLDFLSAVYQLPNLRQRICIRDWDPDEAAEFIRDRVRPLRMSLACIRTAQRRVGRNPLNLDTFLSYISLTIGNGYIPEACLEEYISNCPLENVNHIIFLLIDRLVHSGTHVAGLLFLLGVLGGHAPEDILEACLCQPVHDTLDWLATETPMLWRGQSEVHISHSLYLSAIQKHNYISAFQKQDLAGRLLERLDNLKLDDLHQKAVKIELLQILRQHDRAAIDAFDLAYELFRDGQFHASYRYYTAARESLERAAIEPEALLFRCMLGQISCRLQLEDFTYEELKQRLENCKETLDEAQISAAKRQEYQIEYFIAKNQFLHYFGGFQESLDTVQKILALLTQIKCTDSELIGAMWTEYAIAVKETSTLDNALLTFQDALKVCPDSKNLHFAQLTHLSEKYSAFDPRQARSYLSQITEMESHLNLLDRMHNRVNFATIQFYCGEYEEARSEGIRLYRETYSLGLKNEQGRLANLLGCIMLYSGNSKEARCYFQHGVDIFHGENYVAYLWPLLANLSTLYLLCGAQQEASDAIDKCAAIFRSSYRQRICQTPRVGHTFQKLHIALLSLAGTAHELQPTCSGVQKLLSELYDIADGSVVSEALRSIRSRKDAIKLAKGSTFCVNGEIYIKD